jgi:hypothetical protein
MWTVLAIVGGGLVAGCGSSSSTTTSSQSTSTPAAASSTSTTTTTPATTAGSGVAIPNVQAAVAACKQTIQSQTTLSAGAKSKLEAVCSKAAKGDTTAVKQAAREVCEEVIKTSAVPAGPAREQALAACKSK